MNQNQEFKAPFWATRGFRRLLGAVVLAGAVPAVVIYEIIPEREAIRAKAKAERAAETTPPPPGPPAVKVEGVKDGTPIGEFDEPYRDVVRYLQGTIPGVLAKESRRIGYPLFQSSPGGQRGRVVRLLALYLKTDPIRPDPPIDGVEWIYQTYLADPSGEEGYVVDLIERPPDIRRRALTATDAVFLKLGTYENKKGVVQVPYFLGRGLTEVHDKGEADVWSGGGAILVALATLAVLGVMLLSFRASRAGPPRRLALPKTPKPPAD